jgi:hypothetical protein
MRRVRRRRMQALHAGGRAKALRRTLRMRAAPRRCLRMRRHRAHQDEARQLGVPHFVVGPEVVVDHEGLKRYVNVGDVGHGLGVQRAGASVATGRGVPCSWFVSWGGRGGSNYSCETRAGPAIQQLWTPRM